ncbi:MAG: hypothetical protein IJQ42_04605 [Oscillospiraceae bacterium]|nr:hypothetical protein [Oscillospiraceae bacterium]
MTEQLQAKMKIIDNMTVDEIKAMTLFEFDEFAADLHHTEARTLLKHFFDRMFYVTHKIPSVDFSNEYIELVSCDFNVLEVIFDHFFQEDVPFLEKHLPETADGMKKKISAITDIYNDYSESIRGRLNTFLDR